MINIITELFNIYLPGHDTINFISRISKNNDIIYTDSSDIFFYKKLKSSFDYEHFIKELFLYYYYYIKGIGPEILNVYYKISDKNKYYITIKLKKYNSNIKTYIQNKLIYSEFNEFFKKIQNIINILFDLDIIATDIKYENFLIDSDKNIVITNFEYDNCFSKIKSKLFKPFLNNNKQLFNITDIDEIKQICTLSLFFYLCWYLSITQYSNSIYNRNIKSINFDYNIIINNNIINNISTDVIHNQIRLDCICFLYEYGKNFCIIIYKLLKIFNVSNINDILRPFAFGYIINLNLFELIRINLIDKFNMLPNYNVNTQLNPIKEGSYGFIYNYNDFLNNSTISTLIPTYKIVSFFAQLRFNCKWLMQTLISCNCINILFPSKKSVISSTSCVIKISKSYTQSNMIIFEYDLYTNFKNLNIGINVYELHIIQQYYDNYIYGIVMDKYDGDLKEYFLKNIEIIQLEHKIKYIITTMCNNNYLCADFKFSNLLYKINDTDVDIKLTDFDCMFCIDKSKLQTNYDNFDKLLMLTMCMQHIYYLCSINNTSKIKLLLLIFKKESFNLQILFINEKYTINDFSFLNDQSIIWTVNLIKYINNGNNKYHGNNNIINNINYYLQNYMIIIIEAIQIIEEIKNNYYTPNSIDHLITK